MNNQALLSDNNIVFLSFPSSGAMTLCANKLRIGTDPRYSDVVKEYGVQTSLLALPKKRVEEIISTKYDEMEKDLNPRKNWIHFFEEDEHRNINIVDYMWRGNGLFTRHEHSLTDHVRSHGKMGYIFVVRND